ncbi:MAG: tetratricopeptide repeat protein [Methylophilaceae bacterium]|nr:tetratricopeptide repeat protein [Methyloradius sp.]
MGNNSGQVLPAESRATPELALLSENAKLADAGGDAAKAESLYKSVLRQTPNDPEMWFRLGNLYANNNRPDEAAIAYQRCLIADNAFSKAWHNLSMIRLRQAYASMLQAQSTVNESDPLAPRIDDTLEQLSHITVLGDQIKPLSKKAKPPQTDKSKNPSPENSILGTTTTP